MHHLSKNESEYLSNLFDVSEPEQPVQPQQPLDKAVDHLAKIDPACLRRINLLTAKERPFCSFCNAIVGFTWYLRRQKEDTVDKNDNNDGIDGTPSKEDGKTDAYVAEEDEGKLKVVG